ncbi:flocculation protein FLO11-like isoform X4 [Vespula maculifrons]|uniref:Flocculation protein FLO11-like isoform X4 n=1 Tax=Vespula maculifrons TaxID=7453 RepID=A0ABD2CXA7_VESMC
MIVRRITTRISVEEEDTFARNINDRGYISRSSLIVIGIRATGRSRSLLNSNHGIPVNNSTFARDFEWTAKKRKKERKKGRKKEKEVVEGIDYSAAMNFALHGLLLQGKTKRDYTCFKTFDHFMIYPLELTDQWIVHC